MYQGLVKDWPKRVCFGRGSVRELPSLMSGLGRERAFVVCGKTVAGGPMLARVKEALGARFAGAYTNVSAHTPLDQIEAAAAEFRASGADTVVSVGGGSAIDCGKGVVLLFATRGTPAPYAIDYGKTGMARAPMPPPCIAHIAVPTTAGSASDVMPTAAARDPARGIKLLFWDDHMIPDATILDPEMAVYAGPMLTAATGMTAMARSIEALYSVHRHPISTGLALHAARLLRGALPRSVAGPGDLDARADCQMAALMSGTAAINAMVSIVHAIGHVIGGRYGLQHGLSHAILLAPAMQRLLPAIGTDQFLVLEAMGGRGDGLMAGNAGARAVDLLQAMVAALPLPQRLRELGVAAADLPGLAAATMNDYMIANLPRPMTPGEIEDLLREAL